MRAALSYGKPFAVVPCCVFPSLHPSRRLADGRHVSTYAHFCRYLMELAGSGCESALLPFEGRNRVIFMRSPMSLRPLQLHPPLKANVAQHGAEPRGGRIAVRSRLEVPSASLGVAFRIEIVHESGG